MPPITADFTLSYDEFVEAQDLQRRRKRFLAGPPPRSPWIGCAVLAALFGVTLVAGIVATYMTGRSVPAPGGGTPYLRSDAPIVNFLAGLLPIIFVAGVFWLLMARSTLERRILWRMMLLMLAVGASASLTGALTSEPAPPAAPAAANAGRASSFLPFLPALVGVAGVILIIPAVRRALVRVAWDGQPQLQRPLHIEATPDRVLVESSVSRHEYQWAAYVSYSEGPNVFVLSLSALSYQAIPKRAFADAAQVEMFRALVQSRMVDADARTRGFEVLPAPISAPAPAIAAPISAPPTPTSAPLPPPPLDDARNAGTPLPPGRSH